MIRSQAVDATNAALFPHVDAPHWAGVLVEHKLRDFKPLANALKEDGMETSQGTVRRTTKYVQSEDSVRQFEGDDLGSPKLYYRMRKLSSRPTARRMSDAVRE